MADNHFDLVLVWDNLGGAVRVNGGGKATVTDPATGAPVTVVQNGQSVTTVTADSNGRVSFVAQQGLVQLTSGGLSATYTSAEQATAGAANAALAQNAQAAAENAKTAAETARDEAVAATTATTRRRAWTLTSLPEFINTECGYNSASWTQDHVCTVGDYRYVVYWAADKHPHIAQLRLSTGAWSTFDLGTIAGNPFSSPSTGTDGHGDIAMGVDSAGRLHVSGNHHNLPLKYARSNNPHDITSWTVPTMIGTDEDSVTYPQFVNLPDGTLLFAYRNGQSGLGDMFLNRYSTATNSWTRIGKIIDGLASSESPYWNRLAIDDAGTMHLFWCWRVNGSADVNNDFCYAKLSGLSAGQTLTVKKSTGATQTVPITHANAEIIIDTAASGSGLMNQQGADVDTNGHPHAAQWLHDSNGYTQIMHVWHDGSAWHVDKATNLTRHINMASANDPGMLARAAVACGPNGTTYMVYRALYGGRVGKVMGIDVSDGPGTSEFVIADLDLSSWEPSLDTRALRETGHLVMLLSQTKGSYVYYNLDASTVATQWGGVLDIDLSLMQHLVDGTARVPRMRQIGHANLASGTQTVTATTFGAISAMPSLTFQRQPGAQMFARFGVRMAGTTSDTTVYALAREFSSLAASRNFGFGSIVGTTAGFVLSPWMPFLNANTETDDTWVQLMAQKSGTGNGSIYLGFLEVAVLDNWG